MLKQLLDENDNKQIKTDTVQKFDSLNANLSSEIKLNIESSDEFDEDSDMSDISVEDVIDCSKFVKIESQFAKAHISKKFIQFARVIQNKPEILKVKATIFPKVQTTPNQVFKVNGKNENQTVKLKTIVDEDNKDECDEHFWSVPIDNADKTVGLSERNSWKVKGIYVAKPLNNCSVVAKGSPSGTKEVRSEPNLVKGEPK